MSNADTVLTARGLQKRFSGVTALAGVDLTLARGEVHALVGENGAGKSTLIKVITGAYRRDGGTIELEGRPVDFRSPAEAQAAGVVAVYQEVNLLSFRTVAENIYLGREPRRFGFIDWKRMNSDAAALLGRLGLAIDPRAELGSLTIALRQMVAIARGVSLGAKVVVLDEPTSSLTEREVSILYELIRKLKAGGAAVVYISHRFDELYAVCDRVTILRDGKLVGTRPLAGLERLDLVCMMLGKAREDLRGGTTAFERRKPAAAGPAPLFRAEGLASGRKLQGVTIEVGRGEIVGVTGLLGSGRTETARAMFGADRVEKGSMWLDGKPFAPRSPSDAIDAGIGLLAEDRKAEGIIPELSVRENMTLAALPSLAKAGVVSRAKQSEIVDRFMKRLSIKASGPDQKIRELSGGNQQKVLLARWLCRNPRLLLLDEPTRGIDIGAKGDIQALIDELAESGLGVMMISSELEEIVEGATRVLVMRDGRPAAELSGEAIGQDAVLHAMAGGGASEAESAEAAPGAPGAPGASGTAAVKEDGGEL